MRHLIKTALSLTVVSVLAGGTLPAVAAPDAPTQARIVEAYGRLPLSFEANEGQVGREVQYLSRGQGYTLFLTTTEAVLSLSRPQHEAAVVRMRLAGGSRHPRVVGVGALPTGSNYLLGNDPRGWHTGVANYAQVHYEDVYPGIDLIYRGNQRQLEYDFVIAPGADPKRIRLDFQGVDALSIGTQGELILHTKNGDLVQKAPTVYQEAGGRHQWVDGRYVMLANRQVGFEVGRYDRARPLIIDPVLVYSTILSGGSDEGFGIAIDGVGNAYVAGETSSATFPVGGSPVQPAYGGGAIDTFVTKIDPTGTAIVYSTFLGGSSSDRALDIAVDGTGNVYVAGDTTSANFPGTGSSSIQAIYGGAFDAFVTKLNPAGTAIVYSTFLGRSGDDQAFEVTIDGVGNAYVVGWTSSTNFPSVGSPIQPLYGGGPHDAFVAKINPAGTAIVYSTFLGGSGNDAASAIAVDGAGNAYISGFTTSTSFPGVSGLSIQPAYGGGDSDAYVIKLNPAATAVVYSTFLGGAGEEGTNGIAIDGTGSAYLTGTTTSVAFPGVNSSSIQPTNGNELNPTDAFVTKINSMGTMIVYSTFLGGSLDDLGLTIAVDSAGNAYVAGSTTSEAFPGISGSSIQSVNGGRQDVFVAELNPAGTAIVYSTFLGGDGDDRAHGIAVDGAGNAYVAGGTSSTTFLGKSVNPLAPTRAFAVKVGRQTSPCFSPPNTTMVAWYPFDEVTGTLSANRATGNTGMRLNGSTPIPGMVAGALRFDGVDDYVESPSSIVTNIGPADLPETCSGSYSSCRGNFSIDLWIRIDSSSLGGSFMTILDKRAGSAPALKGYHLFVFFGALGLQLADGLGSGFSNYLSPNLTPALADGHWHHIAVTVRRAKHGGLRWYHNGVLFGINDPTDRRGSLENTSPLRIGTRTAVSSLSGWLMGDLDELEIYNRVLKPEEVASIFSAGAAGKCK